MRRVYNFSPGPAAIPQVVLERAASEMLDWQGLGMSVMEVSHRGMAFSELAAKTTQDLREILQVPNHYHILFLAGGASQQFAMLPMNLLGKKARAGYVDTGIWSRKALNEACKYGDIQIIASSAGDYTAIPEWHKWHIDRNFAYLHYTANETIDGIQFPFIPEVGDIPLVSDMTSYLLAEPLDVARFGVIYAGTQKNMGAAGICVVIVRDDLLDQALPYLPAVYHYRLQALNHSFYNTPPTFILYLLSLVLDWIKAQGGLQVIAAINHRKAQKLYAAIDQSNGFYHNRIHVPHRSWINIPFNLPHSELEALFLRGAEERGLCNLKGHKLSGGIRASLYNAMPEAGVDALLAFMDDFRKQYG